LRAEVVVGLDLGQDSGQCPGRVGRVEAQVVAAAPQAGQRPADPLDRRDRLPALPAGQGLLRVDGVPDDGVEPPRLVRPRAVGIPGRDQVGGGQASGHDADRGPDVRAGGPQRMPADRELLPRVEHHVGRVGPGQHDHRPRAEQRGDLRAGIHPRAVLGDHVEVDVGQLVPGAAADRAEHRDRADPFVAGVVRGDAGDERLVCRAAERRRLPGHRMNSGGSNGWSSGPRRSAGGSGRVQPSHGPLPSCR
jgi:hypothetical protein